MTTYGHPDSRKYRNCSTQIGKLCNHNDLDKDLEVPIKTSKIIRYASFCYISTCEDG